MEKVLNNINWNKYGEFDYRMLLQALLGADYKERSADHSAWRTKGYIPTVAKKIKNWNGLKHACFGNLDESISIWQYIKFIEDQGIEVSWGEELDIEEEMGARYFSVNQFLDVAGVKRSVVQT